MSAAVKKIVAHLQSDFFATMNALTQKQGEAVMKYLGDEYYNEGVSHIPDTDYDRLRETLGRKYGLAAVAPHMETQVTKAKAKLPFFMGSMDKIKPDKNNLVGWVAKYPGQVCISDKLDGISGLVVKQGGKRFLFTRGDGTIGQDITHMLPFINCGDIPGVETYAVRGELIVTKAKYDAVKEGKRGARQMVSGLTGIKTHTAERKALMALIDFVAYEVIVPEALKPSAQFSLLDRKSTFTTVRWAVERDVSIEKLGEVLAARKASSAYEIDGIIVAHDAVYPRVVGNPDHAFAFKMQFADQQATTEVLRVVWEASKDGYLKPTVNFEPVNIGGVVIQYASGFNAQFIHTHGLGPGAFIDIIRSGDVIPYIKEVKSVAPGGPAMPDAKWHWNETHVDAVLDDAAANPDVQKRALLYFAQTLEIGYCGEGNITKVYDMGVHTIPQFLQITEAQLLAGGGFGKASAAKLVAEIDAAKKKATITQWAVGSAIFGRGIGTKRTELAFTIVPKDLSVRPGLVEEVTALGGWSRDSAEGFVANLPEFKKFMTAIGVKAKAPSPVAVVANGKLKDHVVLFTGFHPKDLEEAVVRLGGTLADTWGKKVTILVIKDATVSNEKTKKAIAAGIPVKTAEEFGKML
jgi:NAD-dependent DNA ligase